MLAQVLRECVTSWVSKPTNLTTMIAKTVGVDNQLLVVQEVAEV